MNDRNMGKLFSLIVIFFSVNAIAQESKVIDVLREYDFSADLLIGAITDAHPDVNHSFDVTMTSFTDSTTVLEEARFDPTRKSGKRWILLSYNGKEPSKKELRSFNKEFNKKEDYSQKGIADSSWEIEIDNDDYLVISFNYVRTTLPHRYKFLADCIGKAYINKNTKYLEKTEFVNKKPIKIWPLNVTDLYMVVNYVYNEEEKTFQVKKETLNMAVKAFGRTVRIKDTYEYYNYCKIQIKGDL